ncbi:hypothetical protein BTA51_15830 [Hahella sp. CCB-MM4]|uniref:hypothetical protein n=1 Tax=Hahella sp. (strain CCB-MM4) TaxID=1926491 RepID=UPI000B9C68DC|nr:hypothetical protein [Hahella sp. CCB-MM4]OZG72579.1 hypothetical protein BTA51_15830 [Hahella sp. CCB-MM4]
MQHFSFLTLAFIGFGFTVLSTVFVHRDHPEQTTIYDFSVPRVELQRQSTQYLDTGCASSDRCLQSLVGRPLLSQYFQTNTDQANLDDIFK